MANQAKYIYQNGIRYYQIEEIGLVPGVTSVLSKTKSLEDIESIDNWRERIGEKKAEAILKASQARGTNVHSYIEAFLRQESVKVAAQYQPLIDTLQPILDKVKNLRHIEKFIYHPSGYAGTPDLIADFDGKLTLIDWKTSSDTKKREWIGDYYLQICAYIQAANYCYGLNINNGLIAIAVEKHPQCQLFYLNKEDIETGCQKFQARLAQFNKKLAEEEKVYNPEDLII